MDKFKHVVEHKIFDEKIAMCTHCMLVIDEDGNPDPNWYSEYEIRCFQASFSKEEKCNHGGQNQ
jgi:hypothetical protein